MYNKLKRMRHNYEKNQTLTQLFYKNETKYNYLNV